MKDLSSFEKIREIKQKDTWAGHALSSLLIFFRHWLAQPLASILSGVVIAICISRNEYSVVFWSVLVVYFVLLAGSAYVQKYDEHMRQINAEKSLGLGVSLEQTKKNLVAEGRVIEDARKLNGFAGHLIYKIARDVKHTGKVKGIAEWRETFGFQAMSIRICDCLLEFCKSYFGVSPYVTVYQKFTSSDGKDYCKMIAYANSDANEPPTYSERYYLGNKAKKDYLHSQIFVKGELEPVVLMNGEDVRKCFQLHKTNRKREEKIQQYIGIPMNVCNRGVSFLIQLDSDVPCAFGKDREDVNWFIDSIIKNYASELALFYEMDRFNEVICNNEKKGD